MRTAQSIIKNTLIIAQLKAYFGVLQFRRGRKVAQSSRMNGAKFLVILEENLLEVVIEAAGQE